MKEKLVDEAEGLAIHEITPLTEKDCFYVAQRDKKEFTYPIHEHEECELNLIENAEGARRIVGDSCEVIGSIELVLITGPNLMHAWDQYKCTSQHIRETTIQFSQTLLPEALLQKNQLCSIGQMFERARRGLAFPTSLALRMQPRIVALSMLSGFDAFVQFITILYELSQYANEAQVLSSSAFAHMEQVSESRRIQRVQHYINAYFRENIRLEHMAELAGMTPTAFSRFFRLRTGRTLTDYVIDMRIGTASRLLVDTTMSVAEICFESGFNNLSNFNRIFRKKKNCSPTEFRENYKKKKIIC